MHPREIVHITLSRGTSRKRGFTLGADCPRALFRVGTAPECNWRVFGPGVMPHHFMLLWKTGTLTLIDAGAGALLVDGAPAKSCRSIGSARIQFASAEIVVARTIPKKMPVANDATDTIIRPAKNA